ncbi:hypothetical protein [Leptolyngbya sp. FACHB-16]|uniref:hypothetical protein n=1 Tax=unclassified Leptolyngbya TaxID=2650499 RepID=UPI00168837C7|nr:hypothetical protein [Leptolyngbya sp. FACHB-16]MBD2156282.1 hypothetical protein [Leptolyngbya sp. FACHB-16]
MAAYIKRQLDQADLKQSDLIERLQAIGFETDANTMSRLVNGDLRYPRADLISALAALKIFTDTEGRPLTAEEFVLIACEAIDPPAWAVPDPATTAYPEAVSFLLRMKGSKSVEEFADFLDIPAKDLEAILAGQRPTIGQLLAMHVLFDDGNVLPIGKLYGLVVDAPLPDDPLESA